MHTEIEQKYVELGGAAGFLGKAVQEENTCPDGIGRYRTFEHGSIHHHHLSGVHETHGAIGRKWVALGSERSFLGYPTSDEEGISEEEFNRLIPATGIRLRALSSDSSYGRISYFQHGAIVFVRSTAAAYVLRRLGREGGIFAGTLVRDEPPENTIFQKLAKLF